MRCRLSRVPLISQSIQHQTRTVSAFDRDNLKETEKDERIVFVLYDTIATDAVLLLLDVLNVVILEITS